MISRSKHAESWLLGCRLSLWNAKDNAAGAAAATRRGDRETLWPVKKTGEAMKDSSSAGSDPRQPSTAKPYAPPPISPQDLPVDYAGFLAVVFGVTGVMFRYKLCSWLAIIFCAESLVNMRSFENDLKQISMAMMFAIMGLVTNYFGPKRPAKTQP